MDGLQTNKKTLITTVGHPRTNKQTNRPHVLKPGTPEHPLTGLGKGSK